MDANQYWPIVAFLIILIILFMCKICLEKNNRKREEEMEKELQELRNQMMMSQLLGDGGVEPKEKTEAQDLLGPSTSNTQQKKKPSLSRQNSVCAQNTFLYLNGPMKLRRSNSASSVVKTPIWKY